MKLRLTIVSVLLGFALILGGLAVTAPPLQSLMQASKTRADIVEKAQRAVVHIKVEKTVSQPNRMSSPFGSPQDEFFKRFFPGMRLPQFDRIPKQDQEFRQQGQGSGSIIDPEGYILTNNHVIEGTDKITVHLIDGRQFPAEIVGTDPLSDIAVIKISGENLPTIPIGNSEDMRTGETVIAIGNPFGLSNTVTMGIISAKGRSNMGIVDYENFIQTDAAINPGNSGGPLINLEGKIIGVNTAIFSKNGSYQGIGFSVPINMAQHIMTDLIENGSVSRGWLGVNIQNITPELAKAFAVETSKGALVVGVLEDSPAKKAGLRRGDVIVALNQENILSSDDLRNKVGLITPESKVSFKVIRQGRAEDVDVQLGKRPSNKQLSQVPIQETNSIGVKVQNLTPELAKKFDVQQKAGIVIVEVAENSEAFNAGLRVGNIIQEINRQSIVDVKSFEEALEKADLEKGILLLVSTRQQSQYLVLKTG
ncbi:MAG: DegQ family serine endoprotease [SAR324 cluster bacterium]|nr:DegQ family serine endoprotease [SAR324 cluster bacterium]